MAPKMKKNDDREAVEVPPWLVVMCNTIFFESCNYHPSKKRNDLDRFCIDCANPLCYNCIISHEQLHTHVKLKIRRYIYSDVINKQDLSKFFNCHGIQTYHTNKAKVIFLKQRPQQQQHQQQLKPFNTRDYSCDICDKSLHDNSLYCSIACKIADIHRNDVKKQSVASAETVDDHLSSNKKAENGNKIKDLHKPCKKPRRRKAFPIRAPFF